MTVASALRRANLLLKFLVELAALAALAYWGAHIGHGWQCIAIAIAAPLVTAGLWGIVAAPKSARRLPLPIRGPFEVTVLGGSAVALAAAGRVALAIAFAAVVLLNAALLSLFGQWQA